MGLALPVALLGLFALGLPIAIHLLRRKDLPKLTLPTVVLLGRATATSRRRLQLRDVWLLALRLLLLALVVFAIASPFVTTRAAFDDGHRSSVAIVLDDSMSMWTQDGENGTRIEDAVALAVRTIEALPTGSEVSLVFAGHPARLVAERSDATEPALRVLRTLPETSARGSDLPGAVDLARRSLSAARHDRRLLVLSDFAVHANPRSIAWPERGVQVAIERLGAEDTPNRAVLEAEGAPDPTTPGQVSVRLLLRTPHHEDDGVANAIVIEDESGEVLAEGTAQATGPTTALTLHVPAQATPVAFARWKETSGDELLPADDRRPLMLQPPAAIRALLVDGDPHPTPTRDEVGWFARALESPAAGRVGRVRHRIIDADRFGADDLGEVDVVVLANAIPTARASAALRRFVEAGGGLLIAMGQKMDGPTLTRRLGRAAIARVQPARTVDEAIVAEGAGILEFGNARIRRLYELDPNTDATVVARTGNGSPVLIEGRVGLGRVAMLATTLDDAGTDLPYHPGYVALAHELCGRLSSGRTAPSQRIEAGAPSEPPEGATHVRLPNGERVELAGPFTETYASGVYEWRDADDEVRGRFIVAPPAAESDLRTAALPELPPETVTESGGRSRRPLAPWLFLLAGATLLAEGITRLRRPKPA